MGNLVTETPYSEVTATLEAFDRFGVTREHLTNLRKNEGLARQVADLIVSAHRQGGAGKQVVGKVIDCDADPFVPDGLTVKEKDQLAGRVRGQFVFDPAKVKLHLSQNQQGGKVIKGNKLREELANEPVLNANVLDYLLKNTHLIPEEWKKDASGRTRYIFFWGTIYRDSFGDLYVRYLCFSGGTWSWGYRWLDRDWGGGGPSAVRAS